MGYFLPAAHYYYGSVFLVHCHTDSARQALDALVDPYAQWFGHLLAVQPRFIGGLVSALRESWMDGPMMDESSPTPTRTPPARVLRFVSRRNQLRLRELQRVARFVNRYGHYVRPTAAEAAQLKTEQREDRQPDVDWNRRHGAVPGSARVFSFPTNPLTSRPLPSASKRNTGGADGG